MTSTNPPKNASYHGNIIAGTMADMRIRPAKLTDDFLLTWRNDPETRAQSHDGHEISATEHRQWLAKSLQDPQRAIWVAEIDGGPVATIRIDWNDETRTKCKLSYAVAPQHRGKGIGSRLVRQILESAELQNAAVVAEVKRSNLASQRIFEKAGLQLISENGEILVYGRKPGRQAT